MKAVLVCFSHYIKRSGNLRIENEIFQVDCSFKGARLYTELLELIQLDGKCSNISIINWKEL